MTPEPQRLDHIVFLNGDGELEGQIMAGPFDWGAETFHDRPLVLYYVVMWDGSELLVHDFNIIRMREDAK